MIYLAFAAFIFYMTLKNVRSVGGFDKGLDYIVATITMFIFTLVFIVFTAWAMIALLPSREVYEQIPLVEIKLDDSDIPTYVTISGEPGERVYNYIVRDENGSFVVKTAPATDTKVKESADTDVPSFTYNYEVIDMTSSPVWSFVARWVFLLDDYLKTDENRYFNIPLNSVRRDYELTMDDIFKQYEYRETGK